MRKNLFSCKTTKLYLYILLIANLLVIIACGHDKSKTPKEQINKAWIVPDQWSITIDREKVLLSDGNAPAKDYRITNHGPASVRIFLSKGKENEDWIISPNCSCDVGFQMGSSITLERVDGSATGTCLVVQ